VVGKVHLKLLNFMNVVLCALGTALLDRFEQVEEIDLALAESQGTQPVFQILRKTIFASILTPKVQSITFIKAIQALNVEDRQSHLTAIPMNA